MLHHYDSGDTNLSGRLRMLDSEGDFQHVSSYITVTKQCKPRYVQRCRIDSLVPIQGGEVVASLTDTPCERLRPPCFWVSSKDSVIYIYILSPP